MRHFGDITKLSGYDLPPVSIITGGSPCQDLSVAGKRAGLAGERSGLFMEQIRLIKEMRENDRKNGRTDEHIRPRFMVWKNVPGAFSSNKGEDFRAVLEETAKVAEGDACIPGSPNGKWPHAGCIMGDGWSIAWRVHDAQFWGVPQRRKRIALVADFGGGAAPEILFEREGMSGNSAESGEERKGTAENAERGIGKTGITCLNDQGGSVMGVSENVTGALRAQEHGHQPLVFEPGVASRLGGHCYNDMCGTLRADMGDNQPAVCYGISSYESNAMKSANPHSGVYEAETSRTLDLNGGNPACNQGGMAVVSRAVSLGCGDVSATLTASMGNGITETTQDKQIICIEGNGQRESHKGNGYKESDIMYTLNTVEQHAVACGTEYTEEPYNATTGSFMRAGNSGIVETLMARDYKDPQLVCTSVVRRLTPMECERLQGFPDHWADIGDWVDSKGKKHKGESDSPRYKALGNSIALPFWQWMAEKMVKYVDEKTMASLFSGIGGFELVFARSGCKPVWNSEIESFPEAVTRVHFGDDDLGIEGDYERYL